MLAPVPPKGGDNFSETAYANTTLYVPKGSVNAYKTALGWKNFQNIVGTDTEQGLKGDLNHDGVIDIDDLNLLINVILNGESNDLDTEDLNGDGKVEVDDLNALINVILI